MQVVVCRCLKIQGGRRGWLHCSTKCQRLQSSSWIVDFGSCESEVGCRVAEGGGGGEGGGVCDGLFEQLFGFARAVQTDEGFGAIVEQRGVGMSGLRGDDGSVEGFGLVGVAGFEVDAGEQAGDVGVGRAGGVEFFEEGGGLGDFGVVA